MSKTIQHGQHEMIDILSEDGCGYTLDLHRGNGDGRVVQWLWAKPVGSEPISDAVNLTDSGTAVARRLTDLGLRQGSTAPFTTQLDDEVGLLQTCPFQPVACQGPHVVASGAGLLPHS